MPNIEEPCEDDSSHEHPPGAAGGNGADQKASVKPYDRVPERAPMHSKDESLLGPARQTGDGEVLPHGFDAHAWNRVQLAQAEMRGPGPCTRCACNAPSRVAAVKSRDEDLLRAWEVLDCLCSCHDHASAYESEVDPFTGE